MGGWAPLLATVLILSASSPAWASATDFIDDDGRPGEVALEWLVERGVIDGCDPPLNRMVCPQRVLTRAEAAKILVQLGRVEGILGDRRPGSVDHFRDDEETWDGGAEPFIDHLADLGVVHGCNPPENTRFCPDERLRRGQITKMVVRAFGLEAPGGYVSPWTDTGGEFFAEAARVAAYHGLFDSSAGVFAGEEAIDRAEFARVVVEVFAPGLCGDDPFRAGRVADLAAADPAVSFTAHVLDLDTGCAYALNPDNRQQVASVFKVMVMGGTLLEAQRAGRSLTATQRDLLDAMMRFSANEPVRDLWRSFGGAPWFSQQADMFGLAETDVRADYELVWGRTTSSAYDQADLIRQILLEEGGPVGPESRETAFRLMTGVVESQTWGVTAGVPASWTVAQKNGFAGQTTNSVGVVYDEDLDPDYVVAILTWGWADWELGVGAVEEISSWVAEEMVG